MSPVGVAALAASVGSTSPAPAVLARAVASVHRGWFPSALIAVGIAVASLSAARRRRVRGAVRARCTGASPVPAGSHPWTRPTVGRWDALVGVGWVAATVVGARARRMVGRAHDPAGDRRLGGALLVTAAGMVLGLGPAIAIAAGVGVWAVPLALGLARRRRDRAALVDELPEVVDLVRLGVGSGLNVRLAIEAVGRHHDGRIAAELRVVLARVQRGERLADALDSMGAAWAAVQPMVDALVAAERDGAPLVDALDRVAADARTARRRRREESARRVPVKLLFPLVFCTLPAFVLLTVVPVLLRSLPSLAP